MKDVLFTGNTGYLKKSLYDNLGEDIRPVIADGRLKVKPDIKGRTFGYGPEDDAFSQLFDVYSVHTLVFVSGYASGDLTEDDEALMLERALLHAAHAHVDKVVVLNSVESMNYVPVIGRSGEVTGRDYYRAVSLRSSQIEEICQLFARTTSLKIVTLRIPYLADARDNDNGFLGSVFSSAFHDGKVILPYRREDNIDFISQRDLGDLIRRVVEEDSDEADSYIISSGYRHTYGDLEDLLRSVEPGLRVIYENNAYLMDEGAYPVRLRREYGWIPKDDMMEQMSSLYERFCQDQKKGAGGIAGIIDKLLEGSGGILRWAELIVLFVLSEMLHYFMGDGVYFRFVDVRLFFIVIMGTVHGIRVGLCAAVLSSLALLFQYFRGGTDWTVLFYNVQNWIPFTIYLMAGSVTGYVKNKKSEEIKFVREEYSLLRDKYIFLNEVYHGAVENKGEYKKQILGFKDSFGRIFDAVQKLDHVLPQEIFLEAIMIMEDILENHTIAIYSVDSNERFGRLLVCSDLMRNRLPKSIDLIEKQAVYKVVRSGEVYKNTGLEDGMPAYANAVFRDERPILIVTIFEADTEQYGMNYMNIFKILCGLIQTSLLRAVDHMELTEEQNYYPGTNVLRPGRFMQILAVHEEMQERGVAEHVLVRFRDTDRQRLSDSLSRIIRTTDVIGEGEDGRLYLILAQANTVSFRFVENRLATSGLSYEIAEKVG